jgi:hypothetical protein
VGAPNLLIRRTLPAFDSLRNIQATDLANVSTGVLLGKPKLVARLQVQPELRARPEELFQAKSGIGSNAALAYDDTADAVGGYPERGR